MADTARLAVAVLAAGASRRFGDTDKLCAEFRGEMLGLHVPMVLPLGEFACASVIASSEDHPCTAGWRDAGLDVLINPGADQGMGTSVALAAQRALDLEADALMIALADMPMVPSSHFTALAVSAREHGPKGIVVSSDRAKRSPPACFGRDHFERLVQLGGDTGARAILSQGHAVACPPAWLIDIDTPEALAALDNPAN